MALIVSIFSFSFMLLQALQLIAPRVEPAVTGLRHAAEQRTRLLRAARNVLHGLQDDVGQLIKEMEPGHVLDHADDDKVIGHMGTSDVWMHGVVICRHQTTSMFCSHTASLLACMSFGLVKCVCFDKQKCTCI